MEKLVEQEAAKGVFQSMDGDIDTRAKRGISGYNDVALSKGFEINCGIKGGKLSGGQK